MQQPPSPSISTMTEIPLTYDEVSMHRSRHFVVALQELKNLRPQLYSAAEYCESSYLYSEQKQAVLENLKDYSVKALVNAVDHLGTVASKLNDLLAEQTSEIASTEVRVASVAQRFRTCQEYTDLEGLKQQCLSKSYPRYHKHYTVPEAGESGQLKAPVPETRKHSGDQSGRSSSPAKIGDFLQRDESPKTPKMRSGPEVRKAASFQSISKVATSNGSTASDSPTGRDASPARRAEMMFPSPSISSSSKTVVTPVQRKASASDESTSLSALMSSTYDAERGHKELRPIPSRSKSMFMSLLGRKKSFKTTRN